MGNHFDEKKFWNHIEEVCCAVMLFVMMIALFAQVFLRFVLSKSSPIIEEYSLYVFLYFVYFASSNAFLRDEHIKIEAVTSMLPKTIQILLKIAIHILNIVFSIIVVKYGMMRVLNQFRLGTVSATLFPLWIMTFSLPLGMVCSIIRSLQCIYLMVKFDILKKGEEN